MTRRHTPQIQRIEVVVRASHGGRRRGDVIVVELDDHTLTRIDLGYLEPVYRRGAGPVSVEQALPYADPPPPGQPVAATPPRPARPAGGGGGGGGGADRADQR